MSSLIGYGGTPNVSKLKGSGYNLVTTPTKTGGQMDIANRLQAGSAGGISSGLEHLSQLAGGGTPEYWQQAEAPAWRQLNEAQGQLASRFSGQGLGGRRSSGFANSSQGLSESFAERLQANRQQMQQSAIHDLLGIGQNLLGQDFFDSFLMPEEKKKKWWQKALGIGLPVAGTALGGVFGGPMGAALGANIGGSFGNAFLGEGGSSQTDFSGIGKLPTKWKG